MRTFALLLACLAGFSSMLSAADGKMSVTRGPATAVIRCGDEIVGTYRFGRDLPKPYLIAVSAPGALELLISELGEKPADELAPGNRVFVAVEDAEVRNAPAGAAAGKAPFGEILTVTAFDKGWLKLADGDQRWIAARDIVPIKAMVTRIVNLKPSGVKDRAHPDYYDHPHHKGVWTSIDEVNGIKFWAEEGRIENASVEVVEAGADHAVLKIENHWLAADGRPLVKEQTRLTVTPQRLLTYDITFSALDQPVTFGDTKEGLFAIRLPNSMREQFAKGPVVNAEGLQGSKECWGQPSRWIDYVGPIGNHNFGVTLMDHPGNPRKSRYHVRDYGLFSINPFGQESYSKGRSDAVAADPLQLAPGEKVRFRYGLYIHRDGVEEGRVATVYEQFAK